MSQWSSGPPVERVEQVDDLGRAAPGGDGGEPHQVAEVDGDTFKELRLHTLPSQQLVCHGAWHHLECTGASHNISTAL